MKTSLESYSQGLRELGSPTTYQLEAIKNIYFKNLSSLSFLKILIHKYLKLSEDEYIILQADVSFSCP